MLHCEWDERKSSANKKKHGVSFEEAKAQLIEMAGEHEEIQPWVDFLATTVKSFIR